MDVDTISLLMMIAMMGLCLFGTLAYLLHYIGVFYNVKVSVGKPIIGDVWIAYKPHAGPYHKCGPHFTEITSLCPKLDSIGIYYDDPQKVSENKLRYVVGVILSKGDEKPSETIVNLLTPRGFKIFQLPFIDHAVKAQFPFVMSVSAVLGARRVYPALGAYISEHKLSAHPFIEFCSSDKIHYLAPLSKQSDFFVPEIKYGSSASMPESAEEHSQDDGSQAANTSDEEESQGTTSSFEEILAEQVNQSDSA